MRGCDISSAELTGGHVHIRHMSGRETLRAVRTCKERGIKVTCEVTPHHFTLTDEAIRGYDTNTKMNPPLREEADRLAMIDGLRDGSIDVIATDHAPHHADEKALEFDKAPFGIVGCETAIPLCVTKLIIPGIIAWPRLIELLSAAPARILNVPGGTLAEGGPADVTVIAPEAPVTINAKALKSKSKNTPFDGWALTGAAAATIVGGKVVFVNDVVAGAERFR